MKWEGAEDTKATSSTAVRVRRDGWNGRDGKNGINGSNGINEINGINGRDGKNGGWVLLRPREESNLHLRLRSAELYPLSYEGFSFILGLLDSIIKAPGCSLVD